MSKTNKKQTFRSLYSKIAEQLEIQDSAETAPAPVKTPVRTPSRPSPSNPNPFRKPDRKPAVLPKPKAQGKPSQKMVSLLRQINKKYQKVVPQTSTSTKEYLGVMEQWDKFAHPDKVKGVQSLGKDLGLDDAISSSADEEYTKAVEYFKKYHPEIAEVSMQSVAPIAMSAAMLLMAAQEIEENNIERLEHLALQTILELPEYTDAKRAYESGYIDFDVELVNNDMAVEDFEQALEDMPEEEIEELEDELADELSFEDEEEKKRTLVNIFIQGSAVAKLPLWEYMRSELEKMDPELPEIYGKLMSVAHLIYWYMPNIDMSAVSKGGAMQIEPPQDEEGIYTIKVRATIFPLLLHELAKGLTEYVTLNSIPTSAKTAQKVINKTDTLENEVVHIMLGRAVWNKINNLFGPSQQKHIYSVLQKLVSLPAVPEDIPDSFIYTIKQIINNPNTSFVKNTVASYISEIDKAMDEYENPEWSDGDDDYIDGEDNSLSSI